MCILQFLLKQVSAVHAAQGAPDDLEHLTLGWSAPVCRFSWVLRA